MIDAMIAGAIGGAVGCVLWVVASRVYMLWRAVR